MFLTTWYLFESPVNLQPLSGNKYYRKEYDLASKPYNIVIRVYHSSGHTRYTDRHLHVRRPSFQVVVLRQRSNQKQAECQINRLCCWRCVSVETPLYTLVIFTRSIVQMRTVERIICKKHLSVKVGNISMNFHVDVWHPLGIRENPPEDAGCEIIRAIANFSTSCPFQRCYV